MPFAAAIFESCVMAARRGAMIHRERERDKEFHFQDWFQRRLAETSIEFEQGGRNSYPDFRLVRSPEGYEVKGLGYPGRSADYDSNSQAPCGHHNGREIYYVFGRYPSNPDGDSYPVIDLVMCHGRFLNATEGYLHKNRSFRGFGSYGDIMIRDRKMYVAPTPFALVDGTVHRRTLIVPEGEAVPPTLEMIGTLNRRESDEIVGAYTFDFRTNELGTRKIANPHPGRQHRFVAYRLGDDPPYRVTMRNQREVLADLGSPVHPDDDG